MNPLIFPYFLLQSINLILHIHFSSYFFNILLFYHVAFVKSIYSRTHFRTVTMLFLTNTKSFSPITSISMHKSTSFVNVLTKLIKNIAFCKLIIVLNFPLLFTFEKMGNYIYFSQDCFLTPS